MIIPAFDRARYARETRATVKLALPLIAGQLSSIGMNAVDVVLAGHYNPHTLAAVAVGANVWLLALVAAIGVMMALPLATRTSGDGVRMVWPSATMVKSTSGWPR